MLEDFWRVGSARPSMRLAGRMAGGAPNKPFGFDEFHRALKWRPVVLKGIAGPI